MSTIKFRIAAKTDVGLVRTNNEDNFQASSDLSGGQMRWVNNEICSLGDKGALIVVADGMGGMNAGEVASELAIETIREYFSPEKLTAEVLKTRYTIEKYMNDAIVAADMKIKAVAKSRPETKGMGTTIVIGWIIDGKLYISWCGDSRAYVYNPSAGLHQISKDHSYVQNLVDKGAITREEAFDFPDSNIITRCLSDGTTKAKPESLLKPYEVCDNDIIMLCTDGLSGMIRDNEMESIIRQNEHNMDALVDELIKAACEAEGSDNITICLCQILQGGGLCNPSIFIDYDKKQNGNKDNFIRTLINKPEDITPKNRHFWLIGIICVLISLVGVAVWWFFIKENVHENINNDVQIEKAQEEIKKDEKSEAEQPDASEPTDNTSTGSGIKGKSENTEGDKTIGTIFQKSTREEPTEESAEESDSDEDEIKLTPITNSDAQNAIPDDGLSQIKTHKYKVLQGDTYYSIAKKFNTQVEILQNLNNNVKLKAGTTINVPK